MTIRFTCLCGRIYAVRDERAGRTIDCPNCAQPVTVPVLHFGERRQSDRRGRDRRRDAGRRGTDRRKRERRQGDRRVQGGVDISDIPAFSAPSTVPGGKGYSTPPSAIPRPPEKSAPTAAGSGLPFTVRQALYVAGGLLVAGLIVAGLWFFAL